MRKSRRTPDRASQDLERAQKFSTGKRSLRICSHTAMSEWDQENGSVRAGVGGTSGLPLGGSRGTPRVAWACSPHSALLTLAGAPLPGRQTSWEQGKELGWGPRFVPEPSLRTRLYQSQSEPLQASETVTREDFFGEGKETKTKSERNQVRAAENLPEHPWSSP